MLRTVAPNRKVFFLFVPTWDLLLVPRAVKIQKENGGLPVENWEHFFKIRGKKLFKTKDNHNQIGNLLYRGSGRELLANLTERLTLAWSFQMVAFQISSEKQVCSANTPRSTIRRPSRTVNFAPPVLLSWFHLLSEAGVDVCFRRASAGASTAQILS